MTVLAPGTGQAALPGIAADYFGLAGVQLPWLAEEYRAREIALVAVSGARVVGLDFDWRRIEPEPGQFEWADTDSAVALAKRHGLRLAPMLLYTPQWASSAPFAPLDYHRAPPVDLNAFREFVYRVVERYKPYGVSRLTADGYGITDWAIWNEPNVRPGGTPAGPGMFWTGSLEEYVALLRAGYEGAHAADPDCNVLNGALADVYWLAGEQDLVTALERLYDPNGDGDAIDGGRPFFDTLNIHTYQLDPPSGTWYAERLDAVLRVMARFGDEHKPIWISETGYGSVESPTADSPYLSEAAQAEALHRVYEACAAYPQIERVFWWTLRDFYTAASADNTAMEAHYGLLRATYVPKPAYLAYGRLTGALGEALSLSAVTDAAGRARATVPASFVARPGGYVVFAAVDNKTEAAVEVYQVVASGADHRLPGIAYASR
jgi:GH35 family endo-1,4-beta-xylanase